MALMDRKPLHAALLAAIRPLASMLLHFGVGYREFAEICKTAFVQAATEEFGLRGRPTNVSRVAAMTGLTRKEVRRLRDEVAGQDLPPVTAPNRPAEVLHAWHTDPRFSDDGEPRPLYWDAPEPSFVSLIRSCAGDLPAGAIRAELRRVGAIAETEDGQLLATRRHIIPPTADQKLIEGITWGLRPLAGTIAHNVAGNGAPRFQRFVESRHIPVARRKALEAELRTRLEAFSEEVDDHLAAEQRDADPAVMLGVGLYYYVDDPVTRSGQRRDG